MFVSVSGAVLSALLFDQSNQSGDQEGFLLGQIVSHVTDTISDSQLNNRKEETVTYIDNYIPTSSPFSWYDHAGRVNKEKLKAVLKGHQQQDVIGWYKWRRQTSMSPSLREKAIHRALLEHFCGVQSKHFIFGLFTSSATSNLATHSMDHIFQYYESRAFHRLPVTIVNLKDTSQAAYKTSGNHNNNPSGGIYADVLAHARPNFVDSSTGRLHQIHGIHTLSSQLHMRLSDLYNTVSSSEEAIGHLSTEVESLRERRKRRRYPQSVSLKDHKEMSSAKSPLMQVSAQTAVSEQVPPVRATRHRSKQDDITEELKDLFITPIPGPTTQAADLMTWSEPSKTPKELPKMPDQCPQAVELPAIPSQPKQTLINSADPPRPVSPTLSSQSGQSGRSNEELDVVVANLADSPSAQRKHRPAAAIVNNDDSAKPASTSKNLKGASNTETPPKKDAFDFVTNMMQDVKSSGGLKRTTSNTTRQTRIQSMFVDKSEESKKVSGHSQRRSLTPTRDPDAGAHEEERRQTRSSASVTLNQRKANTLPSTPRIKASMDDEMSSSPTF